MGCCMSPRDTPQGESSTIAAVVALADCGPNVLALVGASRGHVATSLQVTALRASITQGHWRVFEVNRGAQVSGHDHRAGGVLASSP
jgi:hypothetical protein